MKNYISLHKNSQPWDLPRLNEAADAVTDCFRQIDEGLARIQQKAEAVLKAQEEIRRWCR